MPRKFEYRIVKELPKEALKVKEYADQRAVSTSLIYHELHRGVAKFEMIQFQSINFILPH